MIVSHFRSELTMECSLDKRQSILTNKIQAINMPENSFELEIPPSFQFSTLDAVTLTLAPTKEEEASFAYKFAFEKKKVPNSVHVSKGSYEIRVLHSKLVSYPVPRNIGPVVPHYDNSKVDDPNCEKVIMEYTAFVHHPHQKCGKWTPVKRDHSVHLLFPDYEVEPYNDGSKVNDKGPYSDESMGIVYTCTQHRCSIKCSCKVCTSDRNECYKVCGQWPCQRCTPQCPKHRVGLDRAFNLSKHSYSIKADSNKVVKFMIKHTDIPIDCSECKNDLTDHQSFHRVYHSRCKYCRQLMAPYDYYSAKTVEDYGAALEKIAFRGKVTCAVCLKMFDQPSNCKRHEVVVHGGNGPYGCKECIKKFSNKQDLKYHVDVQHTNAQREPCAQCGKSFKSKLSLEIHQQRIHCDNRSYRCDECDAKFTQRNNLLRHKNEKHFGRNVDWRIVQINEDIEFKCDLCDKVFKRKSHLHEHTENVHKVSKMGKEVMQIKCAHCDKEFSKKSNARRHEKHCKERKVENSS